MKFQLFALLLIILSCSRLFGQDFTGYIKHKDSLSTPIFQAKVTILNGGERNVIKTYFDGSFKFATTKNQNYTVFVAYPGYVDTFFTITTDKEGQPNPPGITIKLKKDGMRLMGTIRSADQKFPIDSATIVLKNILTRKETRQTTDIDGAYNLKLEYETNYSIKIDKMSPGIMDKYRDTTMYVSTIGFNQPLDYKLDIYLDPFGGTIEHQPPGQNDVSNAGASSSEQRQLVTDDNAIKAEQLASALQLRDSLARKAYNDSLTQAALLVNQRRLEDSLAKVSADQKKMRDELNAGKIYADSLAKALLEARQQIALDSVEHAGSEKIKKDTTTRLASIDSVAKARKKLANDSIKHVAEEANIAKERARQKKFEDSIASVQVKARQKTVHDTIPKTTTVRKTHEDSLAKAIVLLRKKLTDDSTAVVIQSAKHKALEDSLIIISAGQQKISRGLVAKKALLDSIQKLRVEQQRLIKELTAKKLSADSTPVQAKITKELTEKKAFEDSLNRTWNEAYKKMLQDSITLAMLWREKLAKEQVAKKSYVDSIVGRLAVLREKHEIDSLVEVGVIRERSAKQKALKYPVAKAQPENAKIIPEAVAPNKTTAANTPTDISKPEHHATKISDTPTLTMPTIVFGKNSFIINQLATDQLKSIISIMGNQALQLHIYALASADENDPRALSLNRANAIVKFLVNEGIPVGRIKSHYLGSDISLSGCIGATCPEQSLIKNRCVAYAIIKP